MKLGSVMGGAGAAAALVALSLALVPQTAGAAAGPTLYVSNSGTNTNNNCKQGLDPCKTIGYALAEAKVLSPLAATIKISAGLYPEQVTISQPVTLIGAGASETIIEPATVPLFDADTDSTEPQFYVVDVTATSGANLEDLGINGSAASASLDSDGYGCGQDYVGVYYHDASGSMTSDAVTGINLPPDLFGCQGGQGVYATADNGSSTTLVMTSDSVSNYDKNGITCDDPGTRCKITETTVNGIGSTPLIAQNGIQIWAAQASLTSDTITNNTYDGPYYAASGILVINPLAMGITGNIVTSNDSNIYLLQDPGVGWQACGDVAETCVDSQTSAHTFLIGSNIASNATNAYGNPVGSGYGDGIDVDSVTWTTSVNKNTVDDNPGNGISLYGATGASVTSNQGVGDGNGLYLGSGTASSSADSNNVLSNKFSTSVVVGILADVASAGNTIESNTSQLNALDAEDNSTGSATAGTANKWYADNCTTSAPGGLCHTALPPAGSAASPVTAGPSHVQAGYRHSVAVAR